METQTNKLINIVRRISDCFYRPTNFEETLPTRSYPARTFQMAGSSSNIGLSGRNFDAFVGSQRAFNDYDFAAKIQEKYWRARQKFLAKIEKKEDSCIVLSDSKLDSKLEIYRSIDKSCAKLTNILENYQNCLFVYANEENSLGILLKECSKRDKTTAGKILAITGKSLTQSSHQRIKLYMPLIRLYQEMETFHSRAVEDTTKTVDKLESKRSQYRASLLWMKDISEKLNPDVYQQLDKFRRVQNQVRLDKKAFDNLQMDVVQKIDLLMASRCNLINQILGSYQAILLETFEKNYNNFRSVEELIKKEDIYEYEFKALTQLNPLMPVSRKESSASGEDLLDIGDLFETLDNEKLAKSTDENNNNNNNSSNNKSKKEEALIDLLANDGDSDAETSSDARCAVGDVDDLLKGLGGDDTVKKPHEKEEKEAMATKNDEPQLIDLLKSDLDEIDNSSYFKTLERLQL